MHSRVPGHFQRTLRAWGSRWPVSAFGNVGRSATFASDANCRSFESPAAALKCHLVHKQNYYAPQSGKFHGCRVVRRLIYERMNIFEGIRCAVLEMWFTMAQVSFHCLVHFCVQKFWRGLLCRARDAAAAAACLELFGKCVCQSTSHPPAAALDWLQLCNGKWWNARIINFRMM